MIPLPFLSELGTPVEEVLWTYRSMIVIIGATSAPALAAAAASDPNLHGRFLVFHCFCSVLRDGLLDCGIGRFAGNETDMGGLLSRVGAEPAIGSPWVALQPASRVIEGRSVHIYKDMRNV